MNSFQNFESFCITKGLNSPRVVLMCVNMFKTGIFCGGGRSIWYEVENFTFFFSMDIPIILTLFIKQQLGGSNSEAGLSQLENSSTLHQLWDLKDVPSPLYPRTLICKMG